jgi:hypothetical protein
MCRDVEVLIAGCRQASCAVLFLFVMCVLDKMAVTCDVANVSASRTPYAFNPLRHSGYQGCPNLGRRGTWATNFCMLRLTFVILSVDLASCHQSGAWSCEVARGFPGSL